MVCFNILWMSESFSLDDVLDSCVVWRSEMNLFANPFARAGYDTRSIFKQSSTGLNSEFSFS